MPTAAPPWVDSWLIMSSSPARRLAAVSWGVVARYIWPRPLIVACHWSSIIDGLSATGTVQAGGLA